MAEPAEKRWTVEEFLAWDDGTDRRYDRDDSFYQFDLAVTCAPADPGRRYIAEPELIIEVLSPSTELHDRGRRLDDYRQLPSLREVLLVASEERGCSTGAGMAPAGRSTT
jgi:Uma2 family endonuclease